MRPTKGSDTDLKTKASGRAVGGRGSRVSAGQGGERALQRVGPVVDDELGKQVDADEPLGRRDQDGLDVARHDPLVDRGHDLLPGGLLAFEIGLHHLVVCLNNRLDEGGVRGMDQFLDLGRQVDLLALLLSLGVLVGALGGHPHQSPQALFAPDRNLDRGDRLAERVP